MDGTRADDLQILLHFMYRGEAYLHHDRINSVLRTAEVLQVKGLSEGPKSFELNSQQQHATGIHGNERSSSAGGGTSSGLHQSTSSAPRSWSPPVHSNSEMASAHQRSSVGIMGNIKRKERDRERDSRMDYQHHPLQRLERDREMEISAHTSLRSSGRSPDRGVSPPQSYPHPREFGMYGSSAFRGGALPAFPGPPRQQDPCSSSYSPSRDTRRSPAIIKATTPPTPPPGIAASRNAYPYGGPQPSKYSPSPPHAHGQQTSDPLKEERERDDPYDLARPSSNRNGERNAGNLSTRSDPILERRTPSDKADRHTPAHGSAGGGDFDQRSSRNSPSPAATPASAGSMGKATPSTFPSDSTTDATGRGVGPNAESGGRGLLRASSYKDERIRRISEATSDIGPSRAHDKFDDYRRSRDDLRRLGSPTRAGMIFNIS